MPTMTEQGLLVACRARTKAEQAAYYQEHQSVLITRSRAYAAGHKNERKTYCRNYGQTHRRAVADAHRKQSYAITSKEFDRMVLEQEGRCRICGNPAQGLEVDHLHGTHIVRGLLCGMCNRGIGMFRDTPVVLRAAAEFIETAGRGK